MVRLGIVGTGRMAVARARAILGHPESELAWVCSRKQATARELLGKLSEDPDFDTSRIATHAGLTRALEAGECSGVVITSPNALHHEQVLQCLAAGVHVFVEYPPAVSVPKGAEMITAARTAGRVLQIGLTHHFAPTTRTLRSVVRGEAKESEVLGNPVASVSLICSGNPISRWYDRDELSGGMFVASLYHFIDEAAFIFGTVTDVQAHYWAQRGRHGVIEQDLGQVFLVFESDATARITYARGFPSPGLRSSRTILFRGGYVEVSGTEVLVRTPTAEDRISPPTADAPAEEISTFVQACATGVIDYSLATHAQKSLEVAIRAQELALKS